MVPIKSITITTVISWTLTFKNFLAQETDQSLLPRRVLRGKGRQKRQRRRTNLKRKQRRANPQMMRKKKMKRKTNQKKKRKMMLKVRM